MVGSGGRSLVGSGGQHRRRPLESTSCATAPGGYRARRRAVTGRVTRWPGRRPIRPLRGRVGHRNGEPQL